MDGAVRSVVIRGSMEAMGFVCEEGDVLSVFGLLPALVGEVVD